MWHMEQVSTGPGTTYSPLPVPISECCENGHQAEILVSGTESLLSLYPNSIMVFLAMAYISHIFPQTPSGISCLPLADELKQKKKPQVSLVSDLGELFNLAKPLLIKPLEAFTFCIAAGIK